MSAPDRTSETTAEKVILFVGGLLVLCMFIATAVVSCVFAVSVFAEFLPLWAAVVLGVPAAALGLALLTMGENTILEKGVVCMFILILFAVMMPVLQRAKHNNERINAMRRPALSLPQHRP